MTTSDMYDVVLLGLCCWREAQNQPKVAQIGQAWSVRNRVDAAHPPGHPLWWGSGYVGVILQPWQYSSFNHNDSNAVKMPFQSDPAWQQCLEVAQDVWQGLVPDPTDGSTHYYDASLDANPPKWATDGSMVHAMDLGQFRFWKRA
jgi:N-acetylmuramoyl-L-alanine amidase